MPGPDEPSSLLHRTHGCTPLAALQPWDCRLLWAACPDCPVLPSALSSQNHRKLSLCYSSGPCPSSLGKGLRGDHHFTPRTRHISPWSLVVAVGSRGWGRKPRCQGTPLPAEPSWAPPAPPPAASPIFLSHLTRANNRGCCFIFPSGAPGTLRGPGIPRCPAFPLPRLSVEHAQGGASSAPPALPDPLPAARDEPCTGKAGTGAVPGGRPAGPAEAGRTEARAAPKGGPMRRTERASGC